LLGDYENAQFSIEEATEGLFSFNQADKYEEVSIGSVDKEAETNEKKTSKWDIIVVDDKELLARNSERIPKNTKKVTFWCLNVWGMSGEPKLKLRKQTQEFRNAFLMSSV